MLRLRLQHPQVVEVLLQLLRLHHPLVLQAFRLVLLHQLHRRVQALLLEQVLRLRLQHQLVVEVLLQLLQLHHPLVLQAFRLVLLHQLQQLRIHRLLQAFHLGPLLLEPTKHLPLLRLSQVLVVVVVPQQHSNHHHPLLQVAYHLATQRSVLEGKTKKMNPNRPPPREDFRLVVQRTVVKRQRPPPPPPTTNENRTNLPLLLQK